MIEEKRRGGGRIPSRSGRISPGGYRRRCPVWYLQLALGTSAPRTEVAWKDKMAHPLPDQPSIAVLPFVNLSRDPKQEFFSDGLTRLSSPPFPSIRALVIARNSTFTYKGKPVKVQQVSEELGVRYVLEGSVQKSGDRIRITAQLIDALTGHHLWAERYDRQLKDLFAVQDEVTTKILTAMRVKLTEGEEAARIRKVFQGEEGSKVSIAIWRLMEGQSYIHLVL